MQRQLLWYLRNLHPSISESSLLIFCCCWFLELRVQRLGHRLFLFQSKASYCVFRDEVALESWVWNGSQSVVFPLLTAGKIAVVGNTSSCSFCDWVADVNFCLLFLIVFDAWLPASCGEWRAASYTCWWCCSCPWGVIGFQMQKTVVLSVELLASWTIAMISAMARE